MRIPRILASFESIVKEGGAGGPGHVVLTRRESALCSPMQISSWAGLAGGALIGLSSLLALILTRKIPGISGIFGRLLQPGTTDRSWRVVFLAGLIAGALLLFATSSSAAVYRVPEDRSLFVFALAGLLVGFGTRFGGGCTSGHGVCGNGMGARDSMVATIVFMASGFLTVYLFRILVVEP